MSPFVFGYFALLIASSSAAVYFKRREAFAVLFTVTLASMLCGAATSLPELVAYRILQGLFGAGLVPLSQSVLLDTYPREHHGRAMAMWGVGVMVGPILGPIFVDLGVHEKKSLERLDTLDPVPRTMIESASDDDSAPDEDADSTDKTLQ